MGIIKKVSVPSLDFSKIATTASNASNGSFLSIDSINTDYWGDENNSVDIEEVAGYDDVYLVTENGVPLGFTTGDNINNDVSEESQDVAPIEEVENTETTEENTSYQNDNITSYYESGNVRSIKYVNEDGSYSIEYFDDNDSGLWSRKVFSDANGKFEKLYKYSTDGEYNMINVYDKVGSSVPVSAMKYNSSWQKISDIEYLENGNYYETMPYNEGISKSLYDNNGNIISSDYIVNDKVVCTYKYENGNISSRTDYFEDGSNSISNYDSSGKITSYIFKDSTGNPMISLDDGNKWVNYNNNIYFINGFGNLACYPASSFKAANDGSNRYYMIAEINGTKYVTVTNYDGNNSGEIVGYYSVDEAKSMGILPTRLDSVPLYNQNDSSAMHKLNNNIFQLNSIYKYFSKELTNHLKSMPYELAFFESLCNIKTIHAISNSSVKEKKMYLKKVYDRQKLHYILKCSDFPLYVRIETLLLIVLGINGHLLFYPTYIVLKKIIRRN